MGVGHVTATEPPPLVEGKVRCPACRNLTSLTPRGRLRRHRDLFGLDCPNTGTGEPVTLDEVPDVVIPDASAPVARPPRPDEKKASRLDVGSTCQGCGKWIPGERRLCGRCYALKV